MNKIAIIEDDIDICNMIAKFLENNKYIVHYALNGAEGIELCKSLVPDLIILDIMLPRLNGNDVLQRLRKFTNAPVIVVSAKTMVQTKIDLNCMVMGAFIGITLMLCVIFKHTAIVVGAMSLFTFSGPLIYMMTWDNMSVQSWRVLTYLKINPMYYWMNTCSYNMINHLEINILTYFVGTVIITFLVSALILRKQEIR